MNYQEEIIIKQGSKYAAMGIGYSKKESNGDKVFKTVATLAVCFAGAVFGAFTLKKNIGEFVNKVKNGDNSKYSNNYNSSRR